MVRIRLRRTGSKGNPFYRVVVANSTDGRNGRFIEVLGTYNPIVKPTQVQIDGEKALNWLLKGAQPTETTAILLNRVGVLDKFFEQRPNARRDYSFLDKRTSAMSVKSVIEAPQTAAAPKPAEAPEPSKPEPVAVAEEAPAEEIPVEAAPEAPAPEVPADEAPTAEANEDASAEASADATEPEAEEPKE